MKDLFISTEVSDVSTGFASEMLGGDPYVGIPTIYEGVFSQCWFGLLIVDDDN